MTNEPATMELAVSYDVDGAEMELTARDVRTVLCDNPEVTDKEVRMFLELCKARHLNPFVKDAYIIKYGKFPASIVVGKDFFVKRAQKNPRFKGFKAGLTFLGKDGNLYRREGSMILQGEHLVGGWCSVYVEGFDHPIYDEVSFDEYVGRKKDGSYNQQWSTKPGTMTRKVALVHGLREAFPDDFQGLYDEAEMGNLEREQQPREVTARVPMYGNTPVELEYSDGQGLGEVTEYYDPNDDMEDF